MFLDCLAARLIGGTLGKSDRLDASFSDYLARFRHVVLDPPDKQAPPGSVSARLCLT
jgi:hypothetical protein